MPLFSNLMKKPNILFIILDALRADNLGCYGYSRNTSPNIDNLSKRGVLFKNAFSTNNATDKSIMAILSGRHIPLKGERDIFLTKEEVSAFFNSGGRFLQEILKGLGYKTYRLNNLWGWQKRGFDFYYKNILSGKKTVKKFMKSFLRDSARRVVHYFPKIYSDRIKEKYGRTNGEENTKTAIKIIEESDEKNPFFMWVDYNDTHIPYNPKQFTNKFQAEGGRDFFEALKGINYQKKMVKFWKGAFGKKSTFEDIIARYDSAIYYDDFLVGKILKALKEKGILENTLIFLFSDHGESFTTQEIYFNHHGLYDVCTHIPLIVSGPGIPSGEVNSSFVHHEDFVPTILDILRTKYNKEDFDGRNLFDKKTLLRKYIFMEESSTMGKRAVRDNRYKYIEAFSKKSAVCSACNQIHGGLVELYDLKKDPEEKNNIAKKNKKKLIEMKSLLNNHLIQLRRINEKRRIKHRIKNIKLKN